MNLNDLIKLDIQDLIELRLTNTVPVFDKDKAFIRKELQHSVKYKHAWTNTDVFYRKLMTNKYKIVLA